MDNECKLLLELDQLERLEKSWKDRQNHLDFTRQQVSDFHDVIEENIIKVRSALRTCHTLYIRRS